VGDVSSDSENRPVRRFLLNRCAIVVEQDSVIWNGGDEFLQTS
jgi:hypothetical protein